MLADYISAGNTMVFVHKDFDVVIQKLGVYTELAKKFIKKHKRYQYIKHVEKLPDDKWCVIFKILPSNHTSIKEYNKVVEQSKKDLWVSFINDFVRG